VDRDQRSEVGDLRSEIGGQKRGRWEGEGRYLGRQGDIEIAYSVNGVPIRLTYERWFHITENHDDADNK